MLLNCAKAGQRTKHKSAIYPQLYTTLTVNRSQLLHNFVHRFYDDEQGDPSCQA